MGCGFSLSSSSEGNNPNNTVNTNIQNNPVAQTDDNDIFGMVNIADNDNGIVDNRLEDDYVYATIIVPPNTVITVDGFVNEVGNELLVTEHHHAGGGHHHAGGGHAGNSISTDSTCLTLHPISEQEQFMSTLLETFRNLIDVRHPNITEEVLIIAVCLKNEARAVQYDKRKTIQEMNKPVEQWSNIDIKLFKRNLLILKCAEECYNGIASQVIKSINETDEMNSRYRCRSIFPRLEELKVKIKTATFLIIKVYELIDELDRKKKFYEDRYTNYQYKISRFDTTIGTLKGISSEIFLLFLDPYKINDSDNTAKYGLWEQQLKDIACIIPRLY
jgi:hypothetical protein